MRFVGRQMLPLFFLMVITAGSGCGKSVGGSPFSDIDDGLSSDYFIESLTVDAPALADPENPNATKLNLKYPFASGEWENELDVPSNIAAIIVTAEARQLWASMYLNGEKLANGKGSPPIDLPLGKTTPVVIVVKAQDQKELAYTIKVTRHTAEHAISTLSSLNVSAAGLELSPAFDPAVKEYSGNTGAETISVSSAAMAANDGAKVEIRVNNDTVADPKAVPLVGGINVIQVVCTAGNGTSTTYALNINRQVPSSSLKLSSLSFAGAKLNETFDSDSTNYTLDVNGAMNPLKLTALSESSSSTVSVTCGADTVDMNAITVPLGTSTIIVTVNNPLGVSVTTKDYMIVVNCVPASSNASLKTLKVTMGKSSSRVIYPGTFAEHTIDPANTKFSKTGYKYSCVMYGFSTIKILAGVEDNYSKDVAFTALRHDGKTNAVVSQKLENGLAAGVINLDIGYVTKVDITVTAGDGSTKLTYTLYVKLLNADEFFWGFYARSFKVSSDSWVKPLPGTFARNGYAESGGSVDWTTTGIPTTSVITLKNYNDGTYSTPYNDGGFILDGIMYCAVDGIQTASQNGWNVTQSGTTFSLRTAQGETFATLDFHLRILKGETARVDNPKTYAEASDTGMTYMGQPQIRFKNVDLPDYPKPFPAGSATWNWDESWVDALSHTGHPN